MVEVVNTTCTMELSEKPDLHLLGFFPYLKLTVKKHRRPRVKNAFKVVVWTKPKTKETLMIYSTGKVVVVGAKSMNGLKKVAEWLEKKLGVTTHDLKCSNIVAVVALEKKLNLDQTLQYLRGKGRTVIYEPSLSPPLIYYTGIRNCKILIFFSGKMIITGAATLQQLDEAVEMIENDFKIKFQRVPNATTS